jgi:HlyD family secretion protein
MPRAAAPALVEIAKKEFVVKITEPGEIAALESVTILAQKDGPIAHLALEGALVSRGDVLVRFDSSQQEMALATARVELKLAEAERSRLETDLVAQRQKLISDLARLKSEARLAEVDLVDLRKKPLPREVEKARLEVEKAKLAFEQAEQKRKVLPALVAKGFITRSTLDEAEMNHLAAMASLQVARFELDKVSAGATPEEIEKATIKLTQAGFALEQATKASSPQIRSLEAGVDRERATVAKATAMIAKAEADLAKTVLRAPQAGLVVYAKAGSVGDKIHPGMMAFAGQTLIHLPDMSSMVVETLVNEVDIGKVEIGAPAKVSLEAFPGGALAGKVRKVGTLARIKSAKSSVPVKVFDVIVQVEDRDRRLKPGLTAMVDIIIERQPDAMTVPLPAVLVRGAESVVLVANGDSIEERRVVLGSSNDEAVVVKTGLRPGERVVIDAATSRR